MQPECKLVAEIGINHNGDMKIVKRLIDIAAANGFWAVKFQKRDVEQTTPKHKWAEPKQTPEGIMTYLEYKKWLELDSEDYIEIDTHCAKRGIRWFGSPWDVASVDFLHEHQEQSAATNYIKIASALNTDLDVLKAIHATGRPVIMSTGMTTRSQFHKAMEIIGGDRIKYILACTSTYPSSASEMNLSFMKTLKNENPFSKIGFSNHSAGLIFAASSVLYGAEMIEIHVTLDRAMFGSDQAASIEPEGMAKLSKYVESLSLAVGDGEWKVWDSEVPVIRNLRWKDFE